jgi:hypothetical protein
LPDGWQSGHIDRRYLVVGRGHLVEADVGGKEVVLNVSKYSDSAEKTHIWKYAKQSILRLYSSPSLALPIQLVQRAYRFEYETIRPLDHLG